MPLVIRAYRPEDDGALVEQFQALNRFEEPMAGNRRLDRQGAIESLAAAQRRVAETDGAVFVAERERRVIGHLFLVIEEYAVHVREELRTYAYVSELFVRAEERRCGVGKALVAAAEKFAVNRGFDRLAISVLAGNTAAADAYVRLGFSPYAIDLTKRIGRG